MIAFVLGKAVENEVAPARTLVARAVKRPRAARFRADFFGAARWRFDVARGRDQ